MNLLITKSASDFRPQYQVTDIDKITFKTIVRNTTKENAEKQGLKIVGKSEFPWLVKVEENVIDNDGSLGIFNFLWQAEKFVKQLEK